MVSKAASSRAGRTSPVSRVVSSSADKTIRGPASKPGLCLFQRTKQSGRFGLLVHGGFGYLSQKSVGLLFLFESLIKKPNGIVQAKLLCPGP